MTLDIERERREFEAAHSGMNFKREDSRNHLYANTTVQGRWTTWLAAKRSMQGSAEPVARLRMRSDGHVDLRELGTFNIPAGTHDLFLAPPAPVSAEPIRQRRLKGAQGWEDVLPTDNDCKGSIVGWEYRTVYSAAPSTDAKDSERLDWVIANRLYRVQGSDKTGWCVLDCSNGLEFLVKDARTHREAIDAAIAAKEAGK